MPLIPVQVTFRGFDHSDALEAEIHERVAWLEQFHAGIVRCRLVVEAPHRHRRGGQHVHVRIELTVPGREPIVISHEPSLHARLRDTGTSAHRKGADVHEQDRYARAAIHEAFDEARRRLEDVAREERGTVKTHEPALHGTVSEISHVDGFGLIDTPDGPVYFNRASVLHDGFDRIAVGTRVAFAQERGEKGPQASTVRVLGKHHYVGP
jgi:cold shock CspA family protein